MIILFKGKRQDAVSCLLSVNILFVKATESSFSKAFAPGGKYIILSIGLIPSV